ncbi:alpha/beta hydrolase [Patescibacteria group bacterium]
MPKTAFRAKMDNLMQDSNNWLLKGAEPFFDYEDKVETSPAKTALLFLHGFSSSPQEIKGIAKYFAELGYGVSLPLLPGHGTHPKDLKDQRWMDWYLTAENSLKKLLGAGYEKVVIVGSSVGTNLSLLLSFQYQDKIKAQIWITPALRLRRETFLRFGTFIVHRFVPFWNYKSKRPIDEFNTVADRSVFEDRVAYPISPFQAVEEVYHINEFTRRSLYRNQTPTLVLLGKKDRVIHGAVKKMLQEEIRPELLEIREFENSKHLLAVDYDKEEVRTVIRDYLDKINQK